MVRKITVRGIVLHNGKLLCTRLKPYKDSLQKRSNDYWCLPGGGLEPGESLVDGVTREMVEETGITPVVGTLLYVQQFAQDDCECLEFFFHITNSEDYLHIDLAKTTHGQEEIEDIDFIDPAATYVLPTFLTTEKLSDFALSDQPTKIVSMLQGEDNAQR